MIETPLQSECLKHLLHNLQKSDKSLLNDPMFALGRDVTSVKPNDCNAVAAYKMIDLSAGQQEAMGHKMKVLQTLVDAQKSALKKLTECLREAEAQKGSLMKDLEDQNLKHQKDLEDATKKAADEALAKAAAAAAASAASDDNANEKTEKDSSESQALDAGDAIKLNKVNICPSFC